MEGWIVLHRLPSPLTIEASIPFYGIFSVFLEPDTYCWLSHHSQVAVSILIVNRSNTDPSEIHILHSKYI